MIENTEIGSNKKMVFAYKMLFELIFFYGFKWILRF